VPLFLLAAALLWGLPANAEETVRIAIVDGASQVTLAGKGLQVRQLEAGEKFADSPGGRSVVYISGDQMLLDGAPVSAPDGVKFRSEGFVKVADQPVRGEIEVRRNAQKKLIAINVVPLEEYLMAVLGSEMPPSFPLEALKAQAVAARTYAVQRKLEGWGRPYHLGSTVLSQVYGGAKAEDPRTIEAVKATRGEVLVFRMEPIEAYFHSSCGGRTEAGSEALGRDLPYLQPADCPCGGAWTQRWTQKITAADLKSLEPGVQDLKVLDRTATGRARTVQLSGASGKRTVTAVDLRRVVGYDRLKSLWFEVEKKKDGVVLSGRGFGHGAGMCQYGAKALAEKGKDYKSILAHYYSGTELRHMY
jgi:stage II sporulation protein D